METKHTDRGTANGGFPEDAHLDLPPMPVVDVERNGVRLAIAIPEGPVGEQLSFIAYRRDENSLFMFASTVLIHAPTHREAVRRFGDEVQRYELLGGGFIERAPDSIEVFGKSGNYGKFDPDATRQLLEAYVSVVSPGLRVLIDGQEARP